MGNLKELHSQVKERKEAINSASITIGFDGFIDQKIKVVDERMDREHFSEVKSMEEFGRLILASSNRGSLREIVVESVEIGGCAVNLGDGFSALGGKVNFFGSIGSPMNPAFQKFSEQCTTCSPLSCEPGLTLAFEFIDGKYMLSSVSHLSAVSRELLAKELGKSGYLEACRASSLIAYTDWSLYPNMTDCWSFIQQEFLAKLETHPYIYIDLVDPRSRSRKDIGEMIEVLKNFESYGKTVFGGNLNEANALAELLDLPACETEGEAVAELSAKLRKRLGISMVTIHCIHGAAFADIHTQVWADGPYSPAPVKSTGAGDRYNAGFCAGLISGLSLHDSLLLGSAASGFFVRNGFSGSLDQILELIDQWDTQTLDSPES